MASSAEVWLWLLLVMQPYNPKTPVILDMYENNASAAAKAVRDGEVSFLSDEERERAKKIRSGAVNEIIRLCEEQDIKIITLDSEDYPPLLRETENPPIVLFCAGNLGGISAKPTISAVGTRSASAYGYNVTREIITSLSRLGTVITSGLAVGLDTAAHKACIEAGGRTIGVCGCGILVDYPKGGGALKRKIVETGGAVISELLPTTKPFAGYFQHRNRIISGISLGTLVLEAGPKSGCLLTAQHACDQGREVFFIPPHDILDARYAGVSELWRDGAVPVFNYLDIFREILKTGSINDYLKELGIFK